MRLFPLCLIPLTLFTFIGCGHKKPPEPFSPPQTHTYQNGTPGGLVKGVGGYFIGDDGFIVLYWDLPAKVDHFKVYKGSELIGATKNYTFLVKEPIKERTVFRVVGYKGKKSVGEVFIEVNP